MAPGSAVQALRQKFGHGLRVAYYRDVVRPRILNTAPVENTTDSRCEIHAMTSAQDWLNLIWSLKSFYAASQRGYALCLHDDGSLPSDARAALEYHFPNARFIDRDAADRRVLPSLEGFPRSHEFRRTNLLAPKVFDFAAYLDSDRMLIFDSDLMFFKTPSVLLQRIENPSYTLNTFNEDCGHGYAVDPQAVRDHIGHELLPRINSGLGLIHKASLRFDWIEEFLGLPGLATGHFWRIEQTLIALCSSRYGTELLPREYTLRLEPGIGERPFRHYVGGIRHLMYGEGMRTLANQGFLARGGC